MLHALIIQEECCLLREVHGNTGEFSGRGLLLVEIPRVGFIENERTYGMLCNCINNKTLLFYILEGHYPNYQLGIGQLLIKK